MWGSAVKLTISMPSQQILRVASALEGTVGEKGTVDRATALGAVRGAHDGFRGHSDWGLKVNRVSPGGQ